LSLGFSGLAVSSRASERHGRGSVVKATDLRPVSLGSTPGGTNESLVMTGRTSGQFIAAISQQKSYSVATSEPCPSARQSPPLNLDD